MERNKVGLIVVAILLVLKVVVVPAIDAINADAERLHQNHVHLNKYERISGQQAVIEKQLSVAESYLSTLSQKMFSGSRAEVTSEAFEAIKAIAKRGGADVRNMRLGELQTGGISYYPVEFTVSGTAHEMADFIQGLESGQRYFITAQARVQSRSKDQEVMANLVIYAVVESEKTNA